jgi:hypothetical protein
MKEGSLPRPRRLLAAGIAASASISPLAMAGGGLAVVSVSPAAHTVTAPVGTVIAVEFDAPVDPKTVTADSFMAFGRWSGAAEGTISFSNGDRRITLVPDNAFSPGESVMVILSHDIEDAGGVPFRSAGYSFQFWTRAGTSAMDYSEIDVMSTQSGEGTRPYGGIASDLDNDGWLDITTVNEDTADLRVFMNRGDGSGLFEDMLKPDAVGNRASPSEPADFNKDGFTDICVANINDDTVSVLLGNGDGSFAPQQLLAVGGDPRGIAVLDVDGDGDVDIVNTNATSGSTVNMSLALNDGTGVFGAPTFFGAGGGGAWALAAADMNDDGILDLVIGARNTAEVIIHTGNGDGTFSFASRRSAGGGGGWMINCGDVNGDFKEDVAIVNASANNGAILLGDGAGNLGAADTYTQDGFPLATDLADLDGDGDLDWVTSSFSGDWRVFTNDGDGTYTFVEELPAPAAASCSLPFDFDNDGDLDLALIDEIADVVILMRAGGSPCPADVDGSGTVDTADLIMLLADWGKCPDCAADIDGSGTVDTADLILLLADWGEC